MQILCRQQIKQGLVFHVNDSHEMPTLFSWKNMTYFIKNPAAVVNDTSRVNFQGI